MTCTEFFDFITVLVLVVVVVVAVLVLVVFNLRVHVHDRRRFRTARISVEKGWLLNCNSTHHAVRPPTAHCTYVAAYWVSR